jgi:enoyl-[acyl-carrier protein] reductase/trans-2-enoyl-CoA reductase (NAD+)
MIVEPKVRGFICTTAHAAGCRENVRNQIEYVKAREKRGDFKNVLVIGASTGYGLSSRITAAFSSGAATIGVMFEKPSNGKKPASAGWYNTAAFEEFAAAEGLYAKSINGDAFSKEVKDETIAMIKNDLGSVDMVIYSLAAPRRTMPDGETVSSVLKTTGEPYTNKTIDLANRAVVPVTIEPATQEEIDATVKVMGGEDWKDWINALSRAGVLADGAVTMAYTYIGPELTHPMYYNGSIGAAKGHLYRTAKEMTEEFSDKKLSAYVSVNKALVTQASSAIPIVPLYTAILYKIMKPLGLHEGCIEQIYRLFAEKLGAETEEECMLRVDDWELREDVQEKVSEAWEKISTENLDELADVDGYWEEFYRMFGFGVDGVDYSEDIEIDVKIPSICE